MSLSRTMDRKGSKVLKVALSAALAAAFTPMAAAPAFAAAPTAQETTAIVSGALGYQYTAPTAYTYTGALFADGSKILAGYTVEQINGTTTKGEAVTDDMARFLGALYRYDDQHPVTAIRYNNAKYVWSDAVGLKGSNWVKDGDAQNTTLVSEVVGALGPNLFKNNVASVQLGISTDGSTYTNITLEACVSTAKLKHDGKTSDTVYSLKSALDAAASGDTVTMTSNAVTDQQLTLKPGVTLDGNGRTLTHLSNNNLSDDSTKGARGAIQLQSDANDKDEATIENLTVNGPNTRLPTTNADGTDSWDSGEFGIKSYGTGAYLVVKNVSVNRAQTAMQATEGGWIEVKGSLRIGDVELGGIEVSNNNKTLNCSSELLLDKDATVTYTETSDTPFAWTDGGGSIENNANLDLARVKADTSKDHYYLSSADSKGAHFYEDNSLSSSFIGDTEKEVTLGGKKEYALLAFKPSAKGTYRFTSSGADAAAELYNINASNGLGTKIASGDNEQDKDFRIFANLEAGKTYILRVTISADADAIADHGNVSVGVAQADGAKLDSYVLSLPANTYYYNDKGITADKLNATAKSAVDGKTLDLKSYTKKIYKVDGATLTEQSGAITEAGKYVLKVTSGNQGDSETACYFNVLDSKKISDYRFTYNNTLVFSSGTIADLAKLAPRGYRYDDSSKVYFDDSNLSVDWYAVKDGVEAPLSTAPSAVGSYVAKLKPNNAAVSGRPTDFDTSSTSVVDLPFSITRGKVAVPSARTGLTYTGSAQVGVSTGANYTLSGTYSATNAGTYSCTATLAEGYSWADGTTAPKTITWSIAKARVSVPSGNSVSYTGKAQVGVSAGTGYTLSGTTSATEPGDYTCTATPTANYMWSDGTTASKTVRWTLAKAAAGITAAPASVVVNRGGRATVALRQAGTAGYTVVSSDSKVATASVSGSSVSITAVASGTATITVSTAATARYAAGSATIAVSVPKSEGENGTVSQTTVNPDGTATTVTSSFKVTTEASASDASIMPTVAFTGTSVKSGKVAVPESVTLADGVTYKVTSVAARAFKGKKVTGITLPKSVTRIGSEAFAKTSRLKTLTLGKTIKSVGKDTLKGSALKSVTVKTSKLSKTSVKNLVKGSKLTTIKCSGVSKKAKANYKKWAKIYKKDVRVK